MKKQILIPSCVAEIELKYRSNVNREHAAIIKNSVDAFQLFMQSWDLENIGFIEQMRLLLLDRKNRAIGILDHTSGCTFGCIGETKLIYAAAIKANASAIVLAHNHPSGDTFPSEPDKKITKEIQKAGVILHIPLADHLIVTEKDYFSFKDAGLV